MSGDEKENQKTMRPPIVVVMGHVDHGKTKILDWYRKTKVVEEESGGITQHIGAYEVLHKGRKITFIDTPGHEAFSKLRSRGAHVADIAVLVVAADEGVKPQTREAIRIIKENELPFVVALNKVDKSGANPERVKQELAKEEVLVESYGGKVPSVDVSATEGKNMDDLLEVILLLSELEHLTTNSAKPAEGVIVEADRDPRRGVSGTLLIREGTLTKELSLVIGRNVETVKILENFLGKPIEFAGPSSPVRMAGLGAFPVPGELFRAFPTKKEAEEYVNSLPKEELSLGSKNAQITEEGKPIFNIILKTDVTGSKEALEEMLGKIQSDAIDLRIVKSEVGDVNESDVKMAQATSRVTIVGFKVAMDPSVKKPADEANIHVVMGEVVYDLLDAVKKEIEERIPPEVTRIDLGKIKILKTFKKDGSKQIVGGRVEEGIARRGVKTDVRRMKDMVGSGLLLELQREKTAVDEVAKGFECGVMVETKTAVEAGDLLELYEEEMTRRGL